MESAYHCALLNEQGIKMSLPRPQNTNTDDTDIIIADNVKTDETVPKTGSWPSRQQVATQGFRFGAPIAIALLIWAVVSRAKDIDRLNGAEQTVKDLNSRFTNYIPNTSSICNALPEQPTLACASRVEDFVDDFCIAIRTALTDICAEFPNLLIDLDSKKTQDAWLLFIASLALFALGFAYLVFTCATFLKCDAPDIELEKGNADTKKFPGKFFSPANTNSQDDATADEKKLLLATKPQ